jgi:hypothetical protein
MGAPGRAEEDTRGGLELGGWAGPNVDDVVNAAMGARMPRSGGLLLGRPRSRSASATPIPASMPQARKADWKPSVSTTSGFAPSCAVK